MRVYKHPSDKWEYLCSILTRSIRTAILAAIVSGGAFSAVEADEYFNPALLSLGKGGEDSAEPVDLSRFEAGGQLPGNYQVDIYLNGQYMMTRDVNFSSGDKNSLTPELSLEDYVNMGLSVAAIPGLSKVTPTTVLAPLNKYVPAGTTQFDFSQQKLNITIPQAMMNERAQGYVDPSLWDEGVPAALLDYRISGDHTMYRGNNAGLGSSNSLFASLRGGVNLGPWRLRNFSSYTRSDRGSASGGKFNNINTYLSRDIRTLRGQLTLGDYATPGDVFDSVQFRGAQLASDDGMLPDSLRGFSPLIRGVANSDAQVSVRQNGQVIYQINVPPGAFEIKDLYPSSDSGDLLVTIKEKDGSERSFTQSYSSVAIMQREGQFKYSLTAGQLRSDGGNIRQQQFMQGVLIYGLPHDVTPYAGILAAQKYLALSAGVGMSLGALGAISADITQAKATLSDNSNSQGQSYRLRYSKSMLETGTTVTLAAYRYSTEGYYNFIDANTYREDTTSNSNSNSSYRPRSEFQVMLNQGFGGFGSLYLSGTQRDFWGREETQRTFTAGYNTNIYGVNYGLNVSEMRTSDHDKTDKRLGFTLSMPLNRFLLGGTGNQRNSANMNYMLNTDQDHNTTQQLGISGTALHDNQLNYSVSQNVGNQGKGYGASLSASYNGSSGTASGGYNYSNRQQQLTYGLNGGVVVHPHGITLGQSLGDTVAIVRAPGAAGIKVNNQTGVKTDWRGYAIVPYLTPYRRTEVALDPTELANNVALDLTSASVVPTRGAVVMANYKTQVGRQAMFMLTHNGKPIPFGAIAVLNVPVEKDDENDNQETHSGIVGDAGQLFMTGLSEAGNLKVQWGHGSDAQCIVPFRLPAEGEGGVPVNIKSECR